MVELPVIQYMTIKTLNSEDNDDKKRVISIQYIKLQYLFVYSIVIILEAIIYMNIYKYIQLG